MATQGASKERATNAESVRKRAEKGGIVIIVVVMVVKIVRDVVFVVFGEDYGGGV